MVRKLLAMGILGVCVMLGTLSCAVEKPVPVPQKERQANVEDLGQYGDMHFYRLLSPSTCLIVTRSNSSNGSYSIGVSC